jgi:hypothetical protein
MFGLRETPPEPPPEKLLQAIWQHQRLRRDNLGLSDGRPVRILHPGFWNHESGPDFRDAVIQIADGAPICGPVELDLTPECWQAHQHHINPAFEPVVLHVVWETRAGFSPKRPTLILNNNLDSPLKELAIWLQGEDNAALPIEWSGKCCPTLGELAPEEVSVLLHEAALARLQTKAAHAQAQAREHGWEQALWEGLFRALGYKHNSWPMQCLAERRQRITDQCREPLQLQARLLGTGGLLPAELTRSRPLTDSYLKRVWDHWWRERDAFSGVQLPAKIWRMNGLRPANHPQRRLALAAHWLADSALPARLEDWFKRDLKITQKAAILLDYLQAPDDDFWTWHWTLRAARLTKPQPLLGSARVTELAMNIILPWFWVRAVEGKNDLLRKNAEKLYLTWPAGEDNSVLKLARKRMLGRKCVGGIKTAAAQQGLLQITRDFCAHSNAVCANCRFPELVRQWKAKLIKLEPANDWSKTY